ncbi:hypothetical protein C8J56DRAFT_893625 [Mycena floridula]|nr:hypothetical protein C8J56DRAFT_893625 [Mycena floridula]
MSSSEDSIKSTDVQFLQNRRVIIEIKTQTSNNMECLEQLVLDKSICKKDTYIFCGICQKMLNRIFWKCADCQSVFYCGLKCARSSPTHLEICRPGSMALARMDSSLEKMALWLIYEWFSSHNLNPETLDAWVNQDYIGHMRTTVETILSWGVMEKVEKPEGDLELFTIQKGLPKRDLSIEYSEYRSLWFSICRFMLWIQCAHQEGLWKEWDESYQQGEISLDKWRLRSMDAVTINSFRFRLKRTKITSKTILRWRARRYQPYRYKPLEAEQEEIEVQTSNVWLEIAQMFDRRGWGPLYEVCIPGEAARPPASVRMMSLALVQEWLKDQDMDPGKLDEWANCRGGYRETIETVLNLGKQVNAEEPDDSVELYTLRQVEVEVGLPVRDLSLDFGFFRHLWLCIAADLEFIRYGYLGGLWDDVDALYKLDEITLRQWRRWSLAAVRYHKDPEWDPNNMDWQPRLKCNQGEWTWKPNPPVTNEPNMRCKSKWWESDDWLVDANIGEIASEVVEQE